MKRYIKSALLVLSSVALFSSCANEVVDNTPDITLSKVYSVKMGKLVSNSLSKAPTMPLSLNVYYNDNKVVEMYTGNKYKAYDVTELRNDTDSIYSFSYKISEEIKVNSDSTTLSVRTYDYHYIDSTSVYEAHINYLDAVADTVTQSLVYNVTIADGEKYL